MANKIRIADLPEFDIADYLDDEQAVAEYLTVVLEENDASALAHALGVIAKARGMREIAQGAGITREALYKALRAHSAPRLDTVQRVLASMGLKLTVRAA